MNWRRVFAIVRKDLGEVTASKAVTIPMAIVPVVLCLVLPAVLLLVGLNGGADALGNMDAVARIVDRYPVPATFATPLDRLLYVFLNYTFLPFFLIIPILVSSFIAANAVVGEKERGTLETLLYTPVTNRELVTAKLAGSFVPAMIVTAGSFIGYFALSNALYGAYRGTLVVRALIWVPGLLLLAPSVSLLGLSAALLVSMRAKTYLEAQQTSGLVVVPFVALVYAQLGGLVIMGPLVVLLLAAAVLGASWLLFSKVASRFNREQILMNL
jgi:ABC-type Na+ efflux pump permease subunit